MKMPKNLRNWGDVYAIRLLTGEVIGKDASGLEDDVFLGCTALETIYHALCPLEVTVMSDISITVRTML